MRPILARRPVYVVALVLATMVAGCGAKTTHPATAPAAPVATGPPAATPSTPAGVPASGASPADAARKPAASAPPLTGITTRAAIESFNDVWRGLRAQDYEPDAASVKTIADNLKDVDVFAVVATWCPDSRRDLPRFFKIADQARWQMKQVRLLAVDRSKKDAGGLTEKWNVTRVPTFIFIRGGHEIGRVVERPTTTLEKDIAAIVAKR